MIFENHTPFPAMAWLSLNNQAKEFTSIVVRVKYLFDTIDEKGIWSLKLDTTQGELFSKDIFYENNLNASVYFESDYIAYKPHADLIINAYTYAKEEISWNCSVKALRFSKENNEEKILVEQKLKVYGERYWVDKLIRWDTSRAEPCSKISLRYENAFGGYMLNPKYKEDKKQKEYLTFYEENPIGKGFHSKKYSDKRAMVLPQIEEVNEPITEPFNKYTPQGLGFIHRSWKSRKVLAGTFDDEWIKIKSPIMPNDFKEEHNNSAHPSLQYKEGYFKGDDIIELYKLLKGKENQSFKLPNFYFKGKYHIQDKELPFYLDIDTVVVDILEEDISKNAIYVSYRTRVRYSPKVESISLNMIVPQDFIVNSEKEEEL